MAPRSSRPASPDNQNERNAPRNAAGIVAPGRLREEDRDAALTGNTRSLHRRVLGLDVLNTPSAPGEGVPEK